MKIFKKIFTNNAMIVIYSIFFLGLTSFALYDVHKIITDYIEDNRLTIVKLQNSTISKFYFVRKPKICLYYPRMIFPKLGTFKNFQDTLLQWWRQENISWPIDISESEQNLILNFFQVYVANNFIMRLDEKPESVRFVGDKLSINRSELHLLVDRFFQNLDTLGITKRAWFELQKIYVQRLFVAENAIQKTNEFITVNYLSSDVACFLISLSDAMTRTGDPKQYYGLDFIHLRNKTEFYHHGIKNMAKTVRVSFPDKNIYFYQQPNNETNERHIITISNKGVFDGKNFPPCTKNFDTEDECLRDLRFRTISKICDCLQFTQIWRHESKNNKHTRFCTSRIYEKCWEKAIEEVERRQNIAKADNRCKPCLISKNNYEISTEKRSWALNQAHNFWWPRASINFLCPDLTYLLYEEKPQFIFSQLISQIGGDLSLYLGFSMIGCLQMIVSFYRLHQKNKKSDHENRIQFLMQNIVHIFHNFDQSTESVQDAQQQVNSNRIKDEYDHKFNLQEKAMKDQFLQFRKFQQETVNRFDCLEKLIKRIDQKLNKVLVCQSSNTTTNQIVTTEF